MCLAFFQTTVKAGCSSGFRHYSKPTLNKLKIRQNEQKTKVEGGEQVRSKVEKRCTVSREQLDPEGACIFFVIWTLNYPITCSKKF